MVRSTAEDAIMMPLPVDLSDDELVAAARAGQADAWDGLVRRHYPPLLRFLTAQTGDAEAAADLTQQTFLDAYRRLHSLDADRVFAAWLYRIARYNLLPFWRRRWDLRHPSLEALSQRTGAAFPAAHPCRELAAVEERDLVGQALADLSPLLREALVLHSMEEMTAREIAAAVNISLAAAERRVSRAAAEFRRSYHARSGPSDG